MLSLLGAKDDLSQASNHILVTSVAKRPQAVIVIFGHIGTNFDQIEKYSKLYHERNCSTICATAPILSLASHDESIIGDIAITACRETARLVRIGELSEMGCGNMPVVVHVLGNGGCQVLEVLEKRILEIVSRTCLDILLERKPFPGLATPSLSGRRKYVKNNPPKAQLCDSEKQFGLEKLEGEEKITVNDLISNSETDETLSTHVSGETGFNENSQQIITPPSTPACVGPMSLNIFMPKCTSGSDNGVSVSENVSSARLQNRRRRRRRSAPQVKRVDIERCGQHMDTPRYNADDTAYRRDIETFTSRLTLGCIVFDSAPYFPSIGKETAAAGVLLSNQAMRLIVQTAVVGSHSMRGLTYFNYLGYLPSNENEGLVEVGRPDQFWKSMKNIRLSKRHAYVYYNADNICERDEIKKIINTHRENNIEIVSETELPGSKHLGHDEWQAVKYADFIGKVITSLDGCTLGEENVSDWFDD